MQKSVLVEIIGALDKKEIRDVHKWLQSPAHNQREDVVQLFEYMCKKINSEESLAKEKAWKYIFPGKEFDDAYMRQVMYFLLKGVESYLVFNELTKDTVHTQAMLLKIFRSRQLDRAFRLKLETTRKQQLKSPYRNSAFLKEQYTLEQEQYYYLVGQKWSMDLNLQETADAFDLSYVADKLRICCLMLSHQGVYKKVSYNMRNLTYIMTYVESHELLKEPAVAAYYNGYKALTEPENESYFNDLEQIIFKQSHLFPFVEIRELYLLAINYCINRINAGSEPFLRKAFQLYKSGFENNILLENGLITKITFGNAVSNALKIREFDWAENFIHKFQVHLEEKHRQSMVHFNVSRLHFERGDYNKAQQLLSKFEYDDMVLNLIAKTMLLKIYYEEEEYSAFESLLEAMRTYLQRKEAISPNHRVVYKNLLSLMRKLIHLNPYSNAQKERFRNTVISTNPLIEREWLLKQVAEN